MLTSGRARDTEVSFCMFNRRRPSALHKLMGTVTLQGRMTSHVLPRLTHPWSHFQEEHLG